MCALSLHGHPPWAHGVCLNYIACPQAYQRIIEKLYELDPNGAMMAFGDMMKKQIVMPAHLMDDNEHAKNNGPNRNLFVDFANVAERSGTYTAMDYADIVDYLIKKWKVRGVGVGLTVLVVVMCVFVHLLACVPGWAASGWV